jgi:hypothetical protein
MCNRREKKLWTTSIPHRDHNYILLIPAYKIKAGSTSDSVNKNKKSGQMKPMLNYRTVLLAQTGICFRILPMALRSTPH